MRNKPLKKQQRALFEEATGAVEAGDLARLLAVLPQLVAEGLLDHGGVLLSNTLLNLALERRADACVGALLDAGADANLGDYKRVTPLMHAASWGSPWTERLLAIGADPQARDAGDFTALHHAAGSILATTEVLATLVNAGLDVNAKENAGRTPLHGAAALICPDKIQELLRLGADPTSKANAEIGTPFDVLHYALNQGIHKPSASAVESCKALLSP